MGKEAAAKNEISGMPFLRQKKGTGKATTIVDHVREKLLTGMLLFMLVPDLGHRQLP